MSITRGGTRISGPAVFYGSVIAYRFTTVTVIFDGYRVE